MFNFKLKPEESSQLMQRPRVGGAEVVAATGHGRRRLGLVALQAPPPRRPSSFSPAGLASSAPVARPSLLVTAGH